jgi:hypothetical protein
MLSPEILLRQKGSLSFLSTALLITLTAQSSLAFSISQSNTIVSETYFLENPSRQGITTLNPVYATSITRGGTLGFQATLQTYFPNWTINTAPNDLAGIFDIQRYAAQGTPTRVGAELILEYIPGAGDPTPLGNTLHWIQRVFDNHNLTNNPGHGNYENVIDSGANDPYYDTVGNANETYFSDFPGRIDAANNHTWFAELYLVEENSPQNITIYNGIQWGWNNNVQPVPEPLTMFGAAAALGYGAILKRKYSKNTKS